MNRLPTAPQTTRVLPLLAGALVGVAFASAACTGGGGGGSESFASQDAFEVDSISVPEGSIWPINVPIEFTFTRPVDFSTVSPNTINIRAEDGTPATGVYSLKRIDSDGDGVSDTTVPDVVVFQPTCPTRDDLSDAGLKLTSRRYTITIVGRSSNASVTLESTTGQGLRTTQRRSFVTPPSPDATTAFRDVRPGPPNPLIRPVGSPPDTFGSYFECGGDPDARVYFEFDETTQEFSLSEPGFEAPLNLYSDPGSRIAALLVFNQPVSPRASNLDDRFLQIEFLDGNDVWRPIETRVRLVRNCTEAGALVRLEPVGILPVASDIRVVIRPGFRDIVGQDVPLPLNEFAMAPTEDVMFSSLMPPDEEGDEILEDFDFGAGSTASREDPEALFETPLASWGGGNLTAAFEFDGTGGPNGTFDWVIRAGTNAVLDTVSDQIVGGEGGVPEDTVNVVNGFVDVRDFIIEQGATLRIQGSQPLCINASRDVIIRGTLDLSGFNAGDITSINTNNQPEPGGPGVAGGGRGGTGSPVVNDSTPKGGDGNGPFAQPGAGGEGGETTYNGVQPENVNRRRPGGGGGGRFAKGQMDPVFGPDDTARRFPACNPLPDVFGLIAQPGYDGSQVGTAFGALSGSEHAKGGRAGFGPFNDNNDQNDFFGIHVERDPVSNELVFTRGELLMPMAGYGGGAGGDAVPASMFPNPEWDISSDEKGGGGGGGGGQVQIKALGRITFGQLGQILCQGGRGAAGENTSFFDHVGGGGGGGSGGHVILETATRIDFTDGDPFLPFGTSPFFKDEENDFEPYEGGRMRILANGGPGATNGLNPPAQLCPMGTMGAETIPPGLGYGGDGGPGVIQLHVPDPLQQPAAAITPGMEPDIIIPINATSYFPSIRDVFRSFMAPAGIRLIPTFGARSRARSEWVSLGAADQRPDGQPKPVRFYFDGTDSTGRIETVDGRVPELPPLLGPEAITGNPTVTVPAVDTVSISGSSLAPLVQDMSALSNDVYLRTPDLLEHFLLRLTVMENPAAVREYDVVGATYDDAATQLDVVVDVGTLGNTIQQFLDLNAGDTVLYTLVPRFFRVVTDGNEDLLDEGSLVRITFQATGADPFGDPDEENILLQTGDISELNDLTTSFPGDVKFVRFEVEFDLGAESELTVETEPVSLDFLRMPFRF